MTRTQESNGIRPSTLKIQNDTNLIKKPTIMSAATATTTTLSSVSSTLQRQPIIIYTHSPRIIRIDACDFMAVVQKLTGFSASSTGDNYLNSTPPSSNNDDAPICTKRRKISIEKNKKSTNGTLQLVPQQWPSIAPIMAKFDQ